MTRTIAINGNDVGVGDGASVLDAINRSGTYISQRWKDPDVRLPPAPGWDPRYQQRLKYFIYD